MNEGETKEIKDDLYNGPFVVAMAIKMNRGPATRKQVVKVARLLGGARTEYKALMVLSKIIHQGHYGRRAGSEIVIYKGNKRKAKNGALQYVFKRWLTPSGELKPEYERLKDG